MLKLLFLRFKYTYLNVTIPIKTQSDGNRFILLFETKIHATISEIYLCFNVYIIQVIFLMKL